MEKKLYVAPETVMIEFDFEDRIAWSGCQLKEMTYSDIGRDECYN